MGNCSGTASEAPSEKHRDIEKDIREQKKALSTEMKVFFFFL